jgi:hypothetical protein
VPDLLRAIEAIATRYGIRIATFGHAGDGNLHPNLIFAHGDPRAEELTDLARADLYRAAIALGGTVTAEHGIGLARRDVLVEQVGADVIDVMRSIKTALDPLGTRAESSRSVPPPGRSLRQVGPSARSVPPPGRSSARTVSAIVPLKRNHRGIDRFRRHGSDRCRHPMK